MALFQAIQSDIMCCCSRYSGRSLQCTCCERDVSFPYVFRYSTSPYQRGGDGNADHSGAYTATEPSRALSSKEGRPCLALLPKTCAKLIPESGKLAWPQCGRQISAQIEYFRQHVRWIVGISAWCCVSSTSACLAKMLIRRGSSIDGYFDIVEIHHLRSYVVTQPLLSSYVSHYFALPKL